MKYIYEAMKENDINLSYNTRKEFAKMVIQVSEMVMDEELNLIKMFKDLVNNTQNRELS
jgi:hypothetical protein